MNINALIYFAFVVEEGSFQAAAHKLKMPKSTLSRHIAALENSLEIQLLNRTTRRFSLTDAGAQIFPSCQKLAEEYREILDITQDVATQPRGTLRITAPVTAGRIFLGRWLAEFQKNYPNIALDVNFTDDQEDLVEQRFDLAIRVGQLRSSTLISRPFATTPRILCASPEFLTQHRLDTLSDISGVPAVVYARSSGNEQWKLKCKKNVIIPIQAKLGLNDMTSVLEATCAGAGIALVPAFIANPYVLENRLVRVFPECEGETAQFNVVYLQRENLPLKTKLLIEHVLTNAKREQFIFQAHSTPE